MRMITLPLWAICSCNDQVLAEETNQDQLLEYVDISSVSQERGIERTESFRFGDAPSRARRIVREGDVLVSTVRTYLKAIAKVDALHSHCIASTGFAVLRSKNNFVDKEFLAWLLKSNDVLKSIIINSKGISYPAITSSDLMDIRVRIPVSLGEQKLISDFLNRKIDRLEAIISKLQNTLTQISTCRQSLITRAVTKGLDPNVAMKNCCISRVDTIPQKWNVATLKYVCWIRARLGWKGLKAEEYTKSGYGFLSAFNIQSNKLIWENLNYISKKRYDESPEIKLSVGDVLLVKDGAGIGKTAYIDNLPIEATTNSSLAVVTPNKNLDYKYLYYYFNSTPFKSLVDEVLNGMGVPHLTQENLNNLKIPIPQIEEQKSIVEFLDNKNEKLLKIEKSIVQTINRLTEYRSSLISAAVTGQLAIDEAAE